MSATSSQGCWITWWLRQIIFCYFLSLVNNSGYKIPKKIILIFQASYICIGTQNPPPVRTPLDCSLGSDSYASSFFVAAWITFFVVSASPAGCSAGNHFVFLSHLRFSMASLWLLDTFVRLLVVLSAVFPLFRDNDEYISSCGWLANKSWLLQLMQLSIPTEGITHWYDKACSTTVDSN